MSMQEETFEHNASSNTPREEKKGCVTGKRLVGCGCGCLTLVIVACILFYLWVSASLPLTPGIIYIDSDTVSVSVVRIDVTDKGTSDLFNAIFGEIGIDEFPPDIREALDNSGMANVSEVLDIFLPIEIARTSPEATRTLYENSLWAVSYHRFPKLIRWLFSTGVEGVRHKNPADVITHKGVEIVRTEVDADEMFCSSIDNNILVSQKLALVERGIERLQQKMSDFGGNILMKEMYDKLPPARDALGIIINKDGAIQKEYEIFERLEKIYPEVDFDRIKAMSWAMDIVSSDLIKGEMYLRFESPEIAGEFSKMFTKDVEVVEREISDMGMASDVEISSDKEFVVVKFDLREFKDNLLARIKGK